MNLSSPEERLAAVSDLADPVRRAVYDLVRDAPAPLSRDDVADSLGLPRATVAAQLDRLVRRGLLAVEFRRLGGRSGPGAGRPSKLYSDAVAEVAASVPQREYELAADLMARAIEEAARTNEPVSETLPRMAREAGAAAAEGAGGQNLDAVLADTGYRPRHEEDGSVTLLECPFHRLSQRYRETVCGMNLAFLGAAAKQCGGAMRAVPDPAGPGRCCVRLEPSDR